MENAAPVETAEGEEKGYAPFVRGVEATWHPEVECFGIFSHWQCPHCGAQLSLGGRICLNACGLSPDSQRRFSAQMAQIVKEMDDKKDA